jgi:tetratricopeptide (TPR) repeat protein
MSKQALHAVTESESKQLSTAARVDHLGVAMTPTDPRCVEIYAKAIRAFNCYRGDPVAIIDEALAIDPNFIMGLVLRAHLHVSMWERSVVPDLRTMLVELKALAPQAHDREQRHIEAIAAWADGEWDKARLLLEYLSADYPRDVLALQAGHLGDFYHGDRDNLRGRVARVLPHFTRDDQGYGFLLGMYSFGLEECGSYAEAEETGRHAMSLEADDCWAHHAVAHVMEMTGRGSEGIAFMQQRRQHWAQPDNGLKYHNWWHLALYHLDHGDSERAIALYDSGVRADPDAMQLLLLDACAMLWRLRLQNIDVGQRWEELAAKYGQSAEVGFYAFNDMHAVMALVANGQQTEAEKWLAEMHEVEHLTTSNGVMTRTVGLPIARAICAFGRQRYDDVVSLLMPVRHRAHAFGGSHAQRDIVHRTLIEAALRAGQATLAHGLLEERRALRPDCPFTWQQLRRAEAAQERPA